MLSAAVDPGLRGCGISVWHNATLTRAEYVKNPLTTGHGVAETAAMSRAVLERLPSHLDYLAVEFPQVYQKSRGDPNDLLPLAAVLGGIATGNVSGQVQTYLPRQWKGTVNPDHLIRAVQNMLSAYELTGVVLPCASLAHNVWDSVGIGLFFHKRLTTRVYPGATKE
jgi:hypothetical protein